MKSFSVILTFLLNLVLFHVLPAQVIPVNNQVFICGWDEVYLIDLDKKWDDIPQKLWSWKAREKEDIPDEYKDLFKSTDDCKPFENGKKILITSSGGGVAYVDRIRDRVLFYGRAGNAHSAELLPGNRIAVAASHHTGGLGDRIILFDIDQPDKPLWEDELSWGHGVVWDEKRQKLWALAHEDLHVYKLKNWDSDSPKLELLTKIHLPEGGGHDLSIVPGTPYLNITTGTKCWLYHRDKGIFKPHPELADHRSVKCISIHPKTRQIMYVQAEGENWWAENIHFFHPEHKFYIQGEHFYKARWNADME